MNELLIIIDKIEETNKKIFEILDSHNRKPLASYLRKDYGELKSKEKPKDKNKKIEKYVDYVEGVQWIYYTKLIGDLMMYENKDDLVHPMDELYDLRKIISKYCDEALKILKNNPNPFDE